MAERSDTRGVAILQLLEEILAELRRGNASERNGAVSSVEIEDMVGKPPKVTTKHYAGSVPHVEEAIDDHAYAKRLADLQWKADWQLTIDQLKGRP